MATWEELTQSSFGSDLWNITNELSKLKSTVFNDISNQALLVGFLVMTFKSLLLCGNLIKTILMPHQIFQGGLLHYFFR